MTRFLSSLHSHSRFLSILYPFPKLPSDTLCPFDPRPLTASAANQFHCSHTDDGPCTCVITQIRSFAWIGGRLLIEIDPFGEGDFKQLCNEFPSFTIGNEGFQYLFYIRSISNLISISSCSFKDSVRTPTLLSAK